MDERDRTILRVITEGGNQTDAATVLGISRQSVSIRLQKLQDALDELETPEMRLLPALMEMRVAMENVRHMLDQDSLDYSLEVTATELAKVIAKAAPWAEEMEWLIRREFVPEAQQAA